MYKILDIEVSDEENEYLLSQQAQGKELKIVDGKVVAIEQEPTQKELAQMEIQELKEWFDTYYTQHEQKYNRLIALGKLTDEGTNPQEELLELYETAEINRKRIQELEKMLGA